MNQVKLGTRVRAMSLDRVDIAPDTKGKCYLLSKDPVLKQLAYDETVRRKVEVDQDTMIKYNLRPIPTLFFLVARLNTDMTGKVSSNDFKIEYIQCSQKIYEDIVDQAEGNPNFNCFTIRKEKKTVQGKDFSFIKPTCCYLEIPQELQESLNKVSENKELMDSLWKLLDVSTSITPLQYEEKLKELRCGSKPTTTAKEPENLPAPEVKQIQSSDPIIPQATDDFGVGDDFASLF